MAQAAIHDFFRNIRLESPDGVTIQTLEADSTTDTLSIKLKNGIAFDDTDVSTDTFGLNVNYQLFVPVGSTTLRLQDVNSNVQDVKLNTGFGVLVNRVSSDELSFTSYGVAENDNLHSITSRGGITNNRIIISNLEIGDINSIPGEDGFSSINPKMQGAGTLDNPVTLQLQYTGVSLETYTETFEFSVANDGLLSYTVSYLLPQPVSSASVSLEREDPLNPGSWTPIAAQSGTLGAQTYQISNIYNETYTGGTVNYRINYNWTGNNSQVRLDIKLQFEKYDIATNVLFQTDTANDELYLNGKLGINTYTPTVTVDINTTDAIKIPTGTELERPTPLSGMIRHNSSIDKIESYQSGQWMPLDNVYDVDLDTYIVAENSPGADDDTLYFYNAGTNTVAVTDTVFDLKSTVTLNVTNISNSTSASTGSIVTSGGIGVARDLTVGGVTNLLGNVNIGDSTSDEVVFTSRIASQIDPSITATYSLGSDTLRFSDLFISDTVNVNNYTLPFADGTINQVVKTNAQGQLFFSDADTFGGNRVYVSAAKGDDANDGVTAPVATIARAARIAAELAYSPITTDPTVEAETTALRAAAQTIADDTITYINTAYPTLVYDSAKCARDVKEIIDSAIYDLRFGGNSRSVAAGEYYYDGTGALYITGQESETIDAINYAKILAVSYLTGSRATAVGASFDTVTSIITNIANAPTKIYGDFITNQITIMVASGDYIEQNPIILGDDISIVGDNLRRVVVRPANENLDMFRVRNSSYITGLVFRDGLLNRVPDYTFRYAISFDNVTDTATSRAGYTNLPVSRPKIFTSPYIQNCSVISFLGGNGVEINGDLIDTPNTPPNDIEAENPVNLVDGIPEQGKSMVANAFTILSFGGVAWRVINDAYAQIVSCFVIFTENGCITQNGGYLSITNSASNFGLFSLRASGYSPNAFEFDRGIISGNGISEVFQTLKVVGLKRNPLEHFVVRVRNNSDIDITNNFNNDSTFGKSASIVASPTSVGGNTITFATPHNFQSGEEVEYDSNGNIEIVGLLNEMTYFVSVVNSTQIQLFNDANLTKPARNLDPTSTSGTHFFRTGFEEFYINEVVSSHNEYQTLTLPAGTYTITPGDTIQATDGSTVINASIYSYDSSTNQLTVSLNLVQTGTSLVRNEFTTNSVIDAGEISAGSVNVVSVSNRNDLYSAEIAIISTENRPMQSIGNTLFNQIYLHRPSIVNSSAHTWEYAGSGTDYNALPQNGGQTDEFFEQVSTLPGRVYTSGTNELGDFKVGDFVRAFNRTGNINFKNKVSIGELDSLALSLSSGVVVDEISTDIDLGDNEIGGPQNSRLVTQLAARSFINNRLGNFIDQNLSTNAVPNAVVQLNGQGQINQELIPPSSGASAFKLQEHNARLFLHEDIPSIDLKSGDIVIEEYQEIVLTLSGTISAVAGETITQANSGATGIVKNSLTNESTLRIISPFSGTFNTTDELTGSTSGALGPSSIPSAVSGPNDVTDNYFLATANASQFLKLETTEVYDFTDIILNATPITGALTGASGTVTEHRVGVATQLDVLNFSNGSGYLTPGAYQDVALTSVTGTGAGALADIVVNGAGSVDSVDITFGGSGYAIGDTLSALANDIGGQGAGGTDFEIDVLNIENRLYIDLNPSIGIQFNATELNTEFTIDDNAVSLTLNQTGETNFGFDASDTGVGGDVSYSNSRITISGHTFADGDHVIYDAGANPSIGGLTNGDTYFVKVIDASTIELYTNYSLNSKITFISSSTGTHQFKIDFVNLNKELFYIAAHGLSTGDAIQYNAATPVTGIANGEYLFVGSVTANTFSLHSARGSALESVNGLTSNPINISADGTGNASIVIQNVSITGQVNTSGKEEENWSNLTATNIDADDIISGIISTSRLATGNANNLTFLRGDGAWNFAVQGLTSEYPVTLVGQSFNDGTDNVYYNDVDISVELAGYENPVNPTSGTETVGVAAFDFNHFNIDANGLVTTKSSGDSGVIDAATLSGQLGSYYLNPVNFSRPVPIEIGGTNLNSYTEGDLLYAATNIGNGGYAESLSKLAIGAANTVLQSTGTAPEWTDSLTLASLQVEDLTDNRIVIAGTGGELEDSANLTFDGTLLTVTGNTSITGTLDVDTDATIATLQVEDLTSGRVVLAGTDGEIEDSANLTFDGTLLTVTGNTSITGTLTVEGTATLNGDIDLGNANTDIVTFTAKVDSNILPSADDTYDLGAAGEAWKDLYLSESVVFEGATANAFETQLSVVDPTQENLINIPDNSGTIAVASNGTTTTTQGDLNTTVSISATGVVTVSGDAHGLATTDTPTFIGVYVNHNNLLSGATSNNLRWTTGSTLESGSFSVATSSGTSINRIDFSAALIEFPTSIATQGSLIFEGATANAFETTLTLVDPTADRTITLPDATGTVALTSDLSSFITLTDLSVTTDTASGSGSLSYNNTTGVFTFTPADLSSYLTAETNDLTANVTWANVPDANITQSSVTQHQDALTITESQISDLQSYLTAESDTLATVTGRDATTTTAISITNSTASTSTSTGALIVTGGVGVGGNVNVGGTLTVSGLTTLQETTEVLNTITSATGTVIHNLSTGAIWYHSSVLDNFTANFTNVPTTNNRTISVVLLINQGATAYLPTAVQIDGAAQTIRWLGASAPAGTANQVDSVSFTFVRTGNAWTVLGSLSTFG